jgi:transposase
MNPKQEGEREIQSIEGLPVVRRDAGAIDIGSEEHWACAPAQNGEGREVCCFGGTTAELVTMAQWFKARGVKSVAIESTGVYWIAPHEVLEAEGLEVLLVDTRQLMKVPGRDKKSDPYDCQWNQRLHSCGLLRGAYRPAEVICKLRTLVRDKANLVAERGDWIRRMQKSLDQMNVRAHHAVKDLNGVTGLAILRAIDAGERDPQKLAQLRDPHCHKSVEEIAEQLNGHWREDHLFSLKQALKMYDAIEERITAYEKEIQRLLNELTPAERKGQTPPALKNRAKAQAINKRGEGPVREALYRMSGVDATQIAGVGVGTIEVVLSEYGPDLSRFPSENEWISHATLAPHVRTTGGKPIKKKKQKHSASTRTAEALRMAAVATRNSDSALGAEYRALSRRLGKDVAVFAIARKIGKLIYRLLRWGQPYNDQGAAAFEKQYAERQFKAMEAKAKKRGYRLVPLLPTPPLAQGVTG